MWTTHADFENLLRYSWSNHKLIEESLWKFINDVTQWNSEVFGNVFHTKRRLILAQNEGIQ